MFFLEKPKAPSIFVRVKPIVATPNPKLKKGEINAPKKPLPRNIPLRIPASLAKIR
jgi:hypothetical protein